MAAEISEKQPSDVQINSTQEEKHSIIIPSEEMIETNDENMDEEDEPSEKKSKKKNKKEKKEKPKQPKKNKENKKQPDSHKSSFFPFQRKPKSAKDIFTSVEIDGASDQLLSGVVDNINEKYGQNSRRKKNKRTSRSGALPQQIIL